MTIPIPFGLGKLLGRPNLELPTEIKWAAGYLIAANHKALIIGGAVRDNLLNRKPNNYNLYTDALPDEIIKELDDVPVDDKFKEYGILTFELETNSHVTINTMRSDGRHIPEGDPKRVRFTKSIKENVMSRSFTIDGLVWDIETSKLIDFVKGQEDIKNKVVRTIGEPEVVFKRHRRRMLMAIRRAAQLDFLIAKSVIRNIRSNTKMLMNIPTDQIREELLGSLSVRGLYLLHNLGVFNVLMPETTRMAACLQDAAAHPEGDVFTHTMKTVKALIEMKADPGLILAGFLHDVGKPSTRQEFQLNIYNGPVRVIHPKHCEVGANIAKEYLTALNFPKEEIVRICWLIRWHEYAHAGKNMTDSKLNEWLSMIYFEDAVRLQHANSIGANREHTRSLKDFYTEAKKKLDNPAPAPIITGEILIDMGYPQDDNFLKILGDCKELEDTNMITTIEQGMEFIRLHYPLKDE